MAEVGCLKDGNFQNLESSSIMLGTASLVAPVETTGKLVVDTSDGSDAGEFPAVADGNAVTMTAETHANSIYIFAKTPLAPRTITLPDITTMNTGDKIVFIVARQSGTTDSETPAVHNVNTITEKTGTSNDNIIIGAVRLISGSNTVATEATYLAASGGDEVGVTKVDLSADVANNKAGSAGTQLVFTVVGSTTKYWLLSGVVASLDPGSSGAGFFIA